MTTETSKRVWSNVAIHPGESLVEELDVRGLDHEVVAKAVGLSSRNFEKVLDGQAPITANLALGLEAVLEVDAVFWMNLQTTYDLTLARNERARTA